MLSSALTTIVRAASRHGRPQPLKAVFTRLSRAHSHPYSAKATSTSMQFDGRHLIWQGRLATHPSYTLKAVWRGIDVDISTDFEHCDHVSAQLWTGQGQGLDAFHSDSRRSDRDIKPVLSSMKDTVYASFAVDVVDTAAVPAVSRPRLQLVIPAMYNVDVAIEDGSIRIASLKSTSITRVTAARSNVHLDALESTELDVHLSGAGTVLSGGTLRADQVCIDGRQSDIDITMLHGRQCDVETGGLTAHDVYCTTGGKFQVHGLPCSHEGHDHRHHGEEVARIGSLHGEVSIRSKSDVYIGSWEGNGSIDTLGHIDVFIPKLSHFNQSKENSHVQSQVHSSILKDGEGPPAGGECPRISLTSNHPQGLVQLSLAQDSNVDLSLHADYCELPIDAIRNLPTSDSTTAPMTSFTPTSGYVYQVRAPLTRDLEPTHGDEILDSAVSINAPGVKVSMVSGIQSLLRKAAVKSKHSTRQ